MQKDRTLFLMITNNCNLKCAGCMQGCDRTTNPFYVNFNDLKNYLEIIKEKQPLINQLPINNIHVTGGDPLTHPDFNKIWELVKELFPNCCLNLSTNGLFLKKYSDQELINLFQQSNITIQLSIYPTTSFLKMCKNIKERLTRLNIFCNFIGGAHFYFCKQDKTNINPINKQKGYTISCQKNLNQQNYVTLINDRIYGCQRSVNYTSQNEIIMNDSIKVLDLKYNQETIQNFNTNFCKICENSNVSSGGNYLLWRHHYKNADFIFQHNFKDLFINYYDIFYDLQYNYPLNYKEIITDQLFQDNLIKDQQRFVNTRFLTGKGDIFIPIESKKILTDDLKNYLNNFKNIIEYNLYFISINNNNEIENILYDSYPSFNPTINLNSYLLKASNLFNAYKTFYKNSCLNNKFILNQNNQKFEIIPLVFK